MPHGGGGLQREAHFPPCTSPGAVPRPTWWHSFPAGAGSFCSATSCAADAFVEEVTAAEGNREWKCNWTSPETRNMRRWHLRSGVLACWLDVLDTFRVILCHRCPLERLKKKKKCHFDALVTSSRRLIIFFSTKKQGEASGNHSVHGGKFLARLS